MTARVSGNASQQETGSGHGTANTGAVAGTVLWSARLSACVTETALAAVFNVSVTAVRDWQAGSSPLADLPQPQLAALRTALHDIGADQRIVADLDTAMWCDLVIGAIADNDDIRCLLADPIASEKAFAELLAWALAGTVPDRYQCHVQGGALTDRVLAERATKALAAEGFRLAGFAA